VVFIALFDISFLTPGHDSTLSFLYLETSPPGGDTMAIEGFKPIPFGMKFANILK
jgi:hypothetical protein